MHEILKEITIMKNGVPKKYIIPDYSDELNELKSDMANKANINHVHMEYADKQHTHKEFYTKNEIDNKLSEMQTGGGGATNLENYITKAEAAEKFAPRTHTHTEFARTNHTHTGYASENHTHSEFALKSHTHTGFANKEHTHEGFASVDHNHNESYYTKAEVDAKVANSQTGGTGTQANLSLVVNGEGNVVTDISLSGNVLTVTKGTINNSEGTIAPIEPETPSEPEISLSNFAKFELVSPTSDALNYFDESSAHLFELDGFPCAMYEFIIGSNVNTVTIRAVNSEQIFRILPDYPLNEGDSISEIGKIVFNSSFLGSGQSSSIIFASVYPDSPKNLLYYWISFKKG